jgi:VIT1/CCC1 family predicted Fe2+/Mn2+ transporter
MKLYIETENNQIKNHPAFEENLMQAFGTIPANWVSFERIEQSVLDIYEVYEGVTYEWVDGIVKDVHHVRAMTDEEKAIKDAQLEEAKTLLANLPEINTNV